MNILAHDGVLQVTSECKQMLTSIFRLSVALA